MEAVRFTIGDSAVVAADLDNTCSPLRLCTRVRRYGRHGTQYEAARDQAIAVLRAVESCPAYSPPGQGGGSEGFGGSNAEVAAVRRASDSIRQALGMPKLGVRRRRRRRR